jgi:hypothetical protein
MKICANLISKAEKESLMCHRWRRKVTPGRQRGSMTRDTNLESENLDQNPDCHSLTYSKLVTTASTVHQTSK